MKISLGNLLGHEQHEGLEGCDRVQGCYRKGLAFPLPTTSFCDDLTYIETLNCEMRHELTQWKCFVPDTPSFYDHIWIFKHKMMLLHCVIGYATSLYPVMSEGTNFKQTNLIVAVMV